MGVAIIVSGVVFVPQLFRRYACVTISDYRTGELLIYDTIHNRVMTDTRYNLPSYWLTPIDYYLVSTRLPGNSPNFSLVLQPLEDGTPVVLEASVRLLESNWLSIQAAWSREGQQVAFISRDASGADRLTIFNLNDFSKRNAPFAQPGGNTSTVWLGDWSHDNAYITVRRFDGAHPYVTLALWSTEAMTLLPMPETMSLVSFSSWSPTGHLLAAVKYSNREGNELLLIDPEYMRSPTRIPLTTEGEIQGIDWSPTGDFFVVSRLRSYTDETSQAHRQWYFDFYGKDGRVLQENVAGKILLKTPPQRAGTVTFIPPNVIPGFWSQNGRTWVMLQDVGESDEAETRLSAYDPAANTFQLMEDHIVSALYLPMFQLTDQRITVAQEGIFPENEFLFLPQWRDGTIELDYLDLRENTRFTLLEGVDAVLSDAYPYSVPAHLLWTPGNFIIPWRTHRSGETEVRLTLLSGEEGRQIAEVSGMEAIEQLRYLNEDWAGFIATRQGHRGIELLNIRTGEHRQVPGEVEEGKTWYGVPSPELTQLAVTFLERSSFTSADRGELQFASLENAESREIHAAAAPFGIWSPDGETFAFLRGTPPSPQAIQVVNSAGGTLADIYLPQRLSADTLSFRGWSHCEANPEFTRM